MNDPLDSSSLPAPRSWFIPGGAEPVVSASPARGGRVQATKDKDHAIQDQKRPSWQSKGKAVASHNCSIGRSGCSNRLDDIENPNEVNLEEVLASREYGTDAVSNGGAEGYFIQH